MQNHHIVYKDKKTGQKDWVVPVTGWWHKPLTHLQQLKATRTNLQKARHIQDAVNHEVCRIAYQLYQIEKKNMNPIKTKSKEGR